MLYNVFLHPLRSYPGPLLWRASRLPFCIHHVSGRLSFQVLDLHRRYGDVVRIAPDELAFVDARAWKDIMGHRPPGQLEMPKAPPFYRTSEDLPTTVVNAGREEHGKLRRELSHGFSEKSLREQEPIIMRYVNLLVQRLKEKCGGEKTEVDMVKCK